MTFYTGLRSTAHSMLGGKGRQMTLYKATPGAYDPATGAASVTEEDYTVTGAEFDYPALLIDGTSIQRGDKKVLLSAQGLSVVPDVGDFITADTLKRNIVGVKALAPDGTVVLYILQVRR